MALTSLEMEQNGKMHRLQFMTEQHPTGLYVAVQSCTDKWIPIGPPSETTDIRDEETYHRELRIDSVKHGTYVPQYSTDPQWNPGADPKDYEIHDDSTL
jgi:hypothetical protein